MLLSGIANRASVDASFSFALASTASKTIRKKAPWYFLVATGLWCVFIHCELHVCNQCIFYVRKSSTCFRCQSMKRAISFRVCFVAEPGCFSENVVLNVLITLCNKIWVMSCPWSFDCQTLFVGYQNHRNGLFSAVKIRLGSGDVFLKSELFRCEKVQKGLIQPGRHLRNGFGLQLF